MRHTFPTLLATALVACAPPASAPAPAPQPIQLATAATDVDYAPFMREGNGVINGQAFLTTRGGDVKVAAGRVVTLDPATPYAKEWYATFGRDLRRYDELPPSELFRGARKTTVADAQGKFRFEGLPKGSYIVRTTVTWETGAAYAGLQGGIVGAVVEVGSSKPSELILNSEVFPPGAVMASVPLLSPEQVGARTYKIEKNLAGISCNMNGGQSISEDAARADLAAKAAMAKVDAVIGVVCKSGGLSFRHNCIQYFECTGNGITWN